MAETVVARPIIGVKVVGAERFAQSVVEVPLALDADWATGIAATAAAALYSAHAPRGSMFGNRETPPGDISGPFAFSIRPQVFGSLTSERGAVGAVITDQPLKRTWLRKGTRRHVIRARRTSALSFWWAREGTWFTGPKVNHPGVWGTTANPHWEDTAYDEVRPILIAYGEHLQRRIVATLGRGTGSAGDHPSLFHEVPQSEYQAIRGAQRRAITGARRRPARLRP